MTILYALTCIKCACSRTINCFKFILLCVSCYHQCICIFKGDCTVVRSMCNCNCIFASLQFIVIIPSCSL